MCSRPGPSSRGVATLVVAALALISTAAPAAAEHGDEAKSTTKASVKVSEVWARTSPMEAKNGAVYMKLKNPTKAGNALVGASVPMTVAMKTELHETKMGPGGTMMMSEVPEIAIAAKSTTKLEPGGYHVMLMDLAQPLVVGDTVKVTLEFAKGPKQTVKAVVKQ